MKRTLSIVLLFVLCLTVLVSCGSKEKAGEATLGLAISVAQSGTDAFGDTNGSAKADATVAAVLLDKNGKIVACAIDAFDAKISFTAAGAIANKSETVSTKNELGDSYSMPSGSWRAQAEAFAQYVIGKTADEVGAIALNEQGKPTDSALSSSCTIGVTGFVSVVKAACADASKADAVKCNIADKLGLAVSANYLSSSDADAFAEKNGKANFNIVLAAVAADKTGKVTAAIVDEGDLTREISTTGTLSDATEFKTKRALGDAYTMPSGTWAKQAAALAKHAVGKTADEIAAIALDTQGKPTDSALTSSCSISVSHLVALASRAAKNAD